MDNFIDDFDKAYQENFQKNLKEYVDIDSLSPALMEKYAFEKCLSEKKGQKSIYLVKRKSDSVLGLLKITTEESVENAAMEAEILRRFSNVNIPMVFDFWEYNGSSFLVREYFEGTPLNVEYERRGAFPTEELLKLALQVGDILASLEQMSIVHKDIKPSNIILSDENEYKLIDFGIARKYEPEKTQDTTLAGTEGFRAPEQGGIQQTTASTDRYGLGKTLLYMAAGTTDLTKGLEKIEHAGLRNLIMILTNMSPDKRFASVYDMLSYVNYLVDGIDPASIEGERVTGYVLSNYTGNDKKLVLYDVAYITPDAFKKNGDCIEEIVLPANFSITALPALKMLKNLASIEVNRSNPELEDYDGVLYDRRTHEMVLFPLKKAGTCTLPKWITGISSETYEDMCHAGFLKNIVCEQGCKYFSSIDGILFNKTVQELILCPCAKSGVVNIPDSAEYIRQQAFQGCINLTDVKIPLERKGEFLSYGYCLCALFDGCLSLPQEFQHDLYFKEPFQYELDSEMDFSCARCNQTRHQSKWAVPQEIVPRIPAPESVWDFLGKPHKSLHCFAGNTIITGPQVRHEYDKLGIPADIPDGLKLHQIKWDSDEEIHSGIIRGTMGGWMESFGCLGHMAWLDNGSVLLTGGYVLGKARVSGRSRVEKDGHVFDKAVVDGESIIKDGAKVSGYAHVTNAIVQNANIYGHAKINGIDVEIKGNRVSNEYIPRIYDNAAIEGYVSIENRAMIYENAQVADYAQICGDAKIYGHALVSGYAIVGRGSIVCDNARATDHANVSGQILQGNIEVSKGPQPWKSKWETGERQPRR